MSTNHYNELTEAEAERLALIIEECGEVIHIAGKCLRHGYSNFNPFDPEKTMNRTLLAQELGDLAAVVQFAATHKDFPSLGFAFAAEEKMKKAAPYLHHQEAPHD